MKDKLTQEIIGIKEAYLDIINALGVKIENFELRLEYTETRYNPNVVVHYNATIKNIPMKPVAFKWHMETQTEEFFLNSIKSWLFSTLDFAVNA